MNLQRLLRVLLMTVAILMCAAVRDVYAHERRMVGNYSFVVGWGEEPAIAGFKNAVQLTLRDASGQPVRDLGDSLRVEVTFGDQKYGPVPLEPAFGSPGEYRTPLIPTRAGVYLFRFTGSIRGARVDQTFTSSDETFDSIRDPAEVEFPGRDPSRAELAQRVERLGARVDTATQEAGRARAAVRTATIVGVVGLLAGVIALALALRRSRMPARV
ncbi:MAG: hypothetical protein ACRDFA_03065 [bacterium]